MVKQMATVTNGSTAQMYGIKKHLGSLDRYRVKQASNRIKERKGTQCLSLRRRSVRSNKRCRDFLIKLKNEKLTRF